MPTNDEFKFTVICKGPHDTFYSRYHEVVFLLIPKGIVKGDIQEVIDAFMYYADAPLTYLIADKSFDVD